MSYLVISKKLIYAILAIVVLFVMASTVHAQGSDVARKYGLTFPVSELGNCNSLDECKTYCSDLANKETCIALAKRKGFYKEQEAKVRQTEILDAAKVELGCATEGECKTFCGEQENWISCGEFAKKHGLGGSKKTSQNEDSRKQAMLEKAKQILGCSSYEECKAFCGKQENHQRCSDFARQVGLQGPTSSKAYENANINASFCQDNPEKCPTSGPNREMCRNLKEKMASASAEELKAYYLKYCAPSPYPNPSFTPYPKPSYSPYPKPSYDPVVKCQSYPGCSWTGDRCQCSPAPSLTTSGNTGTSSSVKGISTIRNFLQSLLDWFK